MRPGEVVVNAGQCTNKRAPRDCDALLLRLSGSPSNLRRPAVIRQTIRLPVSQLVCLLDTSEIRGFYCVSRRTRSILITNTSWKLQKRQYQGAAAWKNRIAATAIRPR